MNEPIKLDGKYKYRNGEPARVLCVDRNDEHSVVAMGEDGTITNHLFDGIYIKNTIHEYDLIPDVPLWEGDIWVHPGGAVCPALSNYPDLNYTSAGYRKIQAREVEQCQS